MSIFCTDRYASSFLEFRRMSDQNDKMKSWLKEKLDEFVENDSLQSEDECRILGVGSGVGEMDYFMLENLQKKQKNIFVRVLEPNAIEMDRFKAKVCSNTNFDVVRFDWRQEDAIDYFKETPDKRFHIIHLLHVLYYFEENEIDDVIHQCFNQLEVGGRLLIIQGSASNRVVCIRNAFANELCLQGTLNTISGEHLLFKMNRLGYKYHSNNIRASLDVSQCLDLTSESGGLLWDFITSVQMFVERSSHNLILKIRNMLTTTEQRAVYKDKTYIPVDSIGIKKRETMSLKKLHDNDKRYAEAFNCFRQVSDQENKMKKWILQDFSKEINSTCLVKINEDIVQMMGIGSGFGQMDMLLFDVIGNMNQKINELVVEPNAVEIEKFKSSIASSVEYSNVTIEYVPKTIDSYNMTRNTTRQFHFIHCIHVLYYVDNPVEVIKHAFDSLLEGGVLLIIQGAVSHGIAHIRNTLGDKMYGNTRRHVPNGKDIEEIIQGLGFNYKADVVDAKLDITECFDSNSDKGNLLLDFITNVDNFYERASPDLKNALYGVLDSDFCFEKDGKTYIKIDCSVIIVTK
ncbi:uncharacterized protein [Antedon mediterranea]|uniref:uncharacterized protein n=1 Tax=Antedon mediterranea TaxID=105859 RepID=UPI003AF4DA4B